MYPDKKRKRENKKNNIIKSFFGVAAFGLIHRYFHFVSKLIKRLMIYHGETMPQSTVLQRIVYSKLQALPIFNLAVRNLKYGYMFWPIHKVGSVTL